MLNGLFGGRFGDWRNQSSNERDSQACDVVLRLRNKGDMETHPWIELDPSFIHLTVRDRIPGRLSFAGQLDGCWRRLWGKRPAQQSRIEHVATNTKHETQDYRVTTNQPFAN